MRKPQPKKHFQIKRMFGLASQLPQAPGVDLHDFLTVLAGKPLSELTFDEANDVIVRLGGVPFTLFRSKRTENYRKQVAGVKTIETNAHLTLIDELAGLRGWSQETLAKFCQRVIKKDSPATTEEGNMIVEALKAMNRRDGLIAFPKTKGQKPKSAAPSQPSFRRVA